MVLPRRAQPGGGIALQTVYQFPERVDRLILIGSGGLGSEVSLVLRAGTGAGRGLPSRCCRFINGLLILVTAARPGAGRATSSSAKTGSAIETLVERQTRLIRLLHLRGRDADSLRAAIAAALADLPPSLIRSIIWDQGIEMARHIDITAALGAPVYFCDSRSPWQRWGSTGC